MNYDEISRDILKFLSRGPYSLREIAFHLHESATMEQVGNVMLIMERNKHVKYMGAVGLYTLVTHEI